MDLRLYSFQMNDRVAGAVMGAFVGKALGVRPHWYYDLEEMHRDYGDWITGYTEPKTDRYHAGLKPGDLSQSGILLKLLVESLVEKNDYDETDFCRRLEEELFPLLDGTPANGPGGYTSQSIREAWRKRVKENRSWRETGGDADTTEAAERALALAARFAANPAKVAKMVSSNTLLTQIDKTVVAMTTAYCCLLALLIQGEPFDDQISGKLMKLVQKGELPFHTVTGDNLASPKAGSVENRGAGNFSSPDALLTPSYIARADADPAIRIEPAWKVSLVYGMPCAIYHQIPAVYYLAARFSDNFEDAVLHALNGGGQNQARTMLTGALVGAQVGLSGIPSRFLNGLTDSAELLALAKKLADQAMENGA